MDILHFFSKLNPTIKTKLNIGFIIIIILLLFIGLYNIYTNSQSLESAKQVVQIYNPSTTLVSEFGVLINEADGLIENWIFVEKKSNTPNKIRLKKLINSDYVKLVSKIEKLSSKWHIKEQNLFLKIEKKISDSLFYHYRNVMNSLNKFENYDDPEIIFDMHSLKEKNGKVSILTNTILLDIENLQKSINKHSTELSEIMINRFSSNVTFLLIIFPIILFLSLFIVFTISKDVKDLLLKVNYHLDRIKSGNLTKILLPKRKDESYFMLDSLNNVISAFNFVLREINQSSEILTDLSQKLNAGSKEISNAASVQATSVSEVAESISDMNNNIQQNNINAKITQNIIIEAVENIKENNKNVNKTVIALQNIINNINIISDIAFQTNILSLNASIEAARAGKYGKSFGVVAFEVGALAEKSNNASEYIEELSENTIRISKETENKSLALIPEIKKTEQLIKDVVTASIQLTNSVNLINNSVNELTGISHKNALFANDMSENASKLLKQVEILQESVKFFKT